MKSDSGPQPFQAFFEALENPAALCDTSLRVLAANPAFELLCGVKEPVGRSLGDLLAGAAAAVPADGGATELDVPLSSGQVVSLTLSRRGDALAVLALARASRAMFEQARTEQALLELGREVAGAVSEEELVEAVSKGVKGLFPGRSFCVRIIDPKTIALTSLYAEGQLLDGVAEVLAFKRSAAETTHLAVQPLPPERVRITAEDPPLMFKGTVRSICAPLVASGLLFGALNVEYPEGMTADLVADDRLLAQLANQVSVGIRNTKLIDELTFVRKYLEELLEHANALIVVTNRERKVVVFNHQMAQLTGLAKEDVLGRDLLQFIPERERMRLMRVIASSLRGEKVGSFETQVLGRDGQEAKVSFATSAVLTPRGEVEGVIAIGQDLTAMKELEGRVIHAEKLTSLGQLAASVVHEINNPMTAVAAYAESLIDGSRGTAPGNRADQEKLKKIVDNSRRILRFTRDLTSYARPAEDTPAPFELESALDAAVGFCDHLLTHHGIRVEKNYATLPRLSGVRANLIQVFVNLITNACQSMQPGGKVGLSTRIEGSDAVVSVSDGGVGIAPKHLERIWEPFFTTKPEGKGTGLGLAIVQQIVEKHGGAVEVTSRLGEGTTFTIRLPLPESAGA